jgi:MFS family permease
MTEPAASPTPRLFTYDFTVLLAAAAFGFCNIAVFYGFASYLERLGVDPAWRGWLLGAEPLAAVCLRPFLSILATPRNALALARISLLCMGLALCGYLFARDIGPIAVVRLFHGASFVCLVSAVTVLLARAIPAGLSGRAFGLFSLSALVPYAIMPLVAERLLPLLGREDRVYAVCSVLVLPGLALLAPLGRRFGRRAMSAVAGTQRPSLAAVRRTVSLTPVRLVLAANLCLFLSATPVFFFMRSFAQGVGLVDPGLFFTVSTVASIAMRLVGGAYYDRLPKAAVLAASLVCLAACMAGFAAAAGQELLLVLAGAYGLCLGVAMPLGNAVMYGLSPPDMRGAALNLMLFTMDVGYMLGPVLGGAILASGAGYPSLFATCCGLALAAAGLAAPLAAADRRERAGRRP